MITNGTVPAKEFEGKLWVLADAYQQLMQAAYTGGVYAEREACAKVCENMSGPIEIYNPAYVHYIGCAEAIRARGQDD